MHFVTIVFAIAAVAPAALCGTLKVPQQYATIQAAVNLALPGDVIKISKGAYAENVLIENKHGIKLKAAGKVVVKPVSGIPISIVDSTGIVLQKLRVKAPGTSSGIQFQSSSDCVVRKCLVAANGLTSCIRVQASDRITLSTNALRGAPYSGISLSSSDDCRVEKNDAKGPYANGISIIGTGNSVVENQVEGASAGIVLRDLGTTANFVADNVLRDQEFDGIFVNSDTGGNSIVENVALKSAEYGIRVEGDSTLLLANRVTKPSGVGIYVSPHAGGSQLMYNDVRKAGSNGMAVHAGGTGVHYNVVKKSGLSGILVGSDNLSLMANLAKQNAGFDLYETPGVVNVTYIDNQFGTFGP